MTSIQRAIMGICLGAAMALPMSAKVQLNPLFTDNMVLQQQSRVPVWGKSASGVNIVVTTSWNGKSYDTQADSNGRWRVDVSTPKAGGPYKVTISDGDVTTLNNVLIGEVWLCSGQSNMEMSVRESQNFEQERIEADRYTNIRLLTVEKATSTEKCDNFKAVDGGWQVCSSATIADFSAAGYFFGRDIHKYRNVPVGLIDSSWGGTSIEVWTSAESLAQVPEYRDQIAMISTLPATPEERQQRYVDDLAAWEKMLRERDKGYVDGIAEWAKCDFDDTAWRKMDMPGMVQEKGEKYFSGIMWLRKVVEIPAEWAGENLILNMGSVDDNDVTYFNGEMIGRTEGWMAPRRYTIPAANVKSGKAVIAVRLMDTGGLGGIGGGAESLRLECEGKGTISLAGDWSYCESLNLRDVPAMPVNTSFWPMPTFLYNAMISPLLPYTIKGAIWYQGEANVDKAYLYSDLMKLMIQDWRKSWNSDFSFYMVQLANYTPLQTTPGESTWAELRESQTEALSLDGTGMAVIIDIGEANDIHPKNKQEVGRRLALAARAKTYGEKVEYMGPMYSGYQIEGNKIRINFEGTKGGLMASNYAAIANGEKNSGEELKGFTIAGPDRQFHWAKARIEGNSVVVWSDEVPMPQAVRYAWADNPIANLYNGIGLPASPFRTDKWNGITRQINR